MIFCIDFSPFVNQTRLSFESRLLDIREKVMERPDDRNGALVIRTKFGEVSAEHDVRLKSVKPGTQLVI